MRSCLKCQIQMEFRGVEKKFMSKLIRSMGKGFSIAVFEEAEYRPFAVYLGTILLKSNLTFKEAEDFISEEITSLSYKPKARQFMKEKRNEMKMTIRGIAPVIGISWQHYSDIESGRKNPSADLTRVLADFFEVPMEKFFENQTTKEKLN